MIVPFIVLDNHCVSANYGALESYKNIVKIVDMPLIQQI